MSVAAVTMCKDEADIVEASLRRMADQVDFLLVADNNSTDGTRDILEQLVGELDLTVIDDPQVGYYQSAKVSGLAARAAEMGADWVIPADIDERWYSPFGRIADVLNDQPTAAIARAELYDHVPTADDLDELDPMQRIGWRRREPGPLVKVAVRPRPRVTIHQGNHGADFGATIGGLLVVRHFPLRSVEQMIRKARNGAAAYAATDLPEDAGAHWRGWGRLTDDELAGVFRQYYWSAAPAADESLIFDPTP